MLVACAMLHTSGMLGWRVADYAVPPVWLSPRRCVPNVPLQGADWLPVVLDLQDGCITFSVHQSSATIHTRCSNRHKLLSVLLCRFAGYRCFVAPSGMLMIGVLAPLRTRRRTRGGGILGSSNTPAWCALTTGRAAVCAVTLASMHTVRGQITCHYAHGDRSHTHTTTAGCESHAHCAP
jgi:hypothetical protein